MHQCLLTTYPLISHQGHYHLRARDTLRQILILNDIDENTGQHTKLDYENKIRRYISIRTFTSYNRPFLGRWNFHKVVKISLWMCASNTSPGLD